MRIVLPTLSISLLASALALAQERPVNAFNQEVYGHLKKIVLHSAEKMPEDNYDFRPVEGVRTFGELLDHVADSQGYFCSLVSGEKKTAPKPAQTKLSKADRIAALKDAFAQCDKAHAGMNKETAAQTVKFMGKDLAKLDALTVNNLHTIEHYGNMVTYLRMKNIVPPSSEEDSPTAKKP